MYLIFLFYPPPDAKLRVGPGQGRQHEDAERRAARRERQSGPRQIQNAAADPAGQHQAAGRRVRVHVRATRLYLRWCWCPIMNSTPSVCRLFFLSFSFLFLVDIRWRHVLSARPVINLPKRRPSFSTRADALWSRSRVHHTQKTNQRGSSPCCSPSEKLTNQNRSHFISFLSCFLKKNCDYYF